MGKDPVGTYNPDPKKVVYFREIVYLLSKRSAGVVKAL